MRILFVDMTCPRSYCAQTLEDSAMGGTEATVVRVAEGLAKQGNQVVVYQHNREETSPHGAAEYAPLINIVNEERPDAVVMLRKAVPLAFLRKQFPDTKLVLWLHDLVDGAGELAHSIPLLEDTKPLILGVSQFHKTQIMDVLMRNTPFPNGYTVDYVYNPVSEELVADATPIDRNKLVFFSSPHKGLEQVLTIYRFVRERIGDPSLRLYVANPGYVPTSDSTQDDVTVLGTLPQKQVIEHVRSALCVFYPNTDYKTRETFGLVFAEANAVGTPVIAHRMGAAMEVLNPKEQALDCNDVLRVVDQVRRYRENRPVYDTKKEFRLGEVLKVWTSKLSK